MAAMKNVEMLKILVVSENEHLYPAVAAESAPKM